MNKNHFSKDSVNTGKSSIQQFLMDSGFLSFISTCKNLVRNLQKTSKFFLIFLKNINNNNLIVL